MRQHFAVHPVKIKDTDIQNVHYDPVYIGHNDIQDLLHPKFSVNFITSFSGSHWCWLCRCCSEDGTLPVMCFMTTLKLTIQLYGCALCILVSVSVALTCSVHCTNSVNFSVEI